MGDIYKSARLSESLNTRTVMYGLMILGGLLIALLSASFGILAGLAVAVIPLGIFLIFSIIANPYWGMIAIFVANYFAMALLRYVPGFSAGIMLDTVISLTVIGILIQACYRSIDLSRSMNGLTAAAAVWMLYCILEIFNMESASFQAWFTSIRGVAGYFLIMALITPVVMHKWRDLRLVLYVWSGLTLIAVLKAYIQKTFGFDAAELHWLYVGGGYTTHIIYSGIRYFSIFSDAANFGATMGLSMVTFSLCALVVKKPWVKIYFFAVAFFALYGLLLSGTRGALAVPFAGYALYILLSRNWKMIVLFTIGMIGAYVFLNHTMYLHGNTYIRRMRSAFNVEDPSFQLRLSNQRKMRGYLSTRPFGVGVGMGGGKAKVYAPKAYMSQIPTDSWFVMIWAETGIVGLLLYIAILIYVLIRCSYIILFKVKDRTLGGVLAGMLCGIFGIIVSSYGNEILGQLPTGIILYMLLAFIFMGPMFDEQIRKERELKQLGDGAK